MAKKAMFTATSKAGTPLNVYGELVEPNPVLDWNGNDVTPEVTNPQVRVWTKYENLGFYNLSRFENETLTAKSLRKLMTGE